MDLTLHVLPMTLIWLSLIKAVEQILLLWPCDSNYSSGLDSWPSLINGIPQGCKRTVSSQIPHPVVFSFSSCKSFFFFFFLNAFDLFGDPVWEEILYILKS